MDELNILRAFLEENKTISFKQSDTKNIIVGCNSIVEDINSLLNINSNVGKDTHMEIEDTPGLSFRSFNLSSVEIYDNSHPVGVDRMKDIAVFAKGSIDITKPIMLHGLRFSRVTSKKEWMNRTHDNIGLPEYPSTKKDLLAISDPSNFGNKKAQHRYC